MGTAEILVNVAFGTLDGIAIMALIWKFFRWPFWEFFKIILVVAVGQAAMSYLDRAVFDIGQYDSLVQLTLYGLAFRGIFKINVYYVYPLAVFGAVSFLAIQSAIYPALLAIGIVNYADAANFHGFGTYLIQFCTQIVAFLVSFALYGLGLGVTYVDIPPHSDYADGKMTAPEVLASLVATAAILTFVLVAASKIQDPYAVAACMIAAAAILVYILKRRESRQ